MSLKIILKVFEDADFGKNILKITFSILSISDVWSRCEIPAPVPELL
jgi:hypothetical protein